MVEGEQSCLVVGAEVEGAGTHFPQWVRRAGVGQEGASASWQVEDLDKEICVHAYTCNTTVKVQRTCVGRGSCSCE